MFCLPDISGLTVIQVIPELETGGAERTTVEIARGLVSAGARAIVVSEGGEMVADLTEAGAEHYEMPVASKNPLTMWANRGRLIDLIRQSGAQVIHARSRAPAWSALWAARAAGIRYVTTYHGIYKAKGAPKRLYNSVMARGDAVIANSAYTAAAVSDAYGDAAHLRRSHFVTIPRGADLSWFDPALLDNARKDAARAAFGGEGAFRVLLPGRLTSWKGQGDLIKTCTILRDKGAGPIRVVLIGSAQGRDGYVAELQTLITEEGLEDIVHIHGHWQDMPAAYDWADVVVSASTRPEAFGRVAIEAQAMARPVVATAHGGALETVRDGETGALVPVSDPAAMAEALIQLKEIGPAGRAEIGEAGRFNAVQRFSTEAMTRATLCVYKQLVNN